MNFFTEDYLLKNETGKKLYEGYSKKMPIFDYHCHLMPKEIYENEAFKNITEAWIFKEAFTGEGKRVVYGDHYKWRLMRAAGFDEEYITGSKSPFEKFEAFAKTLKLAIGNPIYHWAHMELKFFFDIDSPLTEKNAKEIFEKANEKIKTMKARDFIEKSNVKAIITTDDPKDNLEWHKKIKEDESFKTKVLPGFRPDTVVNIENTESFYNYLTELHISNLDEAESILTQKINYFKENGCIAADHGLEYIPFEEAKKEEVEVILKKALNKEALTRKEIDKYKTYMLIFFSKKYKENNWIMQFHYGAIRNINKGVFKTLGPDTGYDTIGDDNTARNLSSLFGYLSGINAIPKVLLFSINPNDIYTLGVLMGSFNTSSSEFQLGPPWWFNDHRNGIETQINALADTSLLGKHIGMLTDSRSFLSYVRHDYHRRIVASIIGEWLEKGEYHSMEDAGELLENISFNNAVKFFGI